MIDGRALVLNATYEPICVVSSRRAVVLLLAGKADAVASADAHFHSAHLTVEVPSVIRLRYFVKVPYRRRAALNRRAVLARDGHRCQYCGSKAETVDHVVPRARGGLHDWANVVAACRPCNSRKRDRLHTEAGMALRSHPGVPRGLSWIVLALGRIPSAWEPFIEVPAPAAAAGA
jgi:5-methylcytosine-specific restriction endonuclease McrA